MKAAALGGMIFVVVLSAVSPATAGPPTTSAIRSGLEVTGAVTPTLYELPGVASRREWEVRLTLGNGTPYAIELGTDLVLVESDETGATFNGVYLSRGLPRPPDATGMTSDSPSASQYAVTNFSLQWADGSAQGYSEGGTYTMRDANDDSRQTDPARLAFGRVVAGQSLSLEADLLQGRWLRFEHAASLRIALPEIVASGSGGTARYRAVAFFAKPSAAGEAWPLARVEIVPLTRGSLRATLLKPEENVVRRIFAANWLMAIDPAAGAAAVARAAGTVASGDLLASCLQLLLASPTPGDEALVAHAETLIADAGTPEGIRTLASRYLSHVGMEVVPPTRPAPPPTPPASAAPRRPATAKGRLQTKYLDYLQSEGYQAEVDGDGDVSFKREGYTYYIIVDEEDAEYFRILLPGIWTLDGNEERAKALRACDRVTRETKVAKASTTQERVSISVELLLPEQDSFTAVFPRCMRILEAARTKVAEEMRK